jgi:hypothetical protein
LAIVNVRLLYVWPQEDWIFDSIIGFLRSPRWKTPVMSFIDEYCIYFDNEDEHKLEFTTHHNVSALFCCLVRPS